MADRIVCFIARSIFRFAGCLDRAYEWMKPSLDKLDAELLRMGRWLYRKAQKG